MAITVVGLGIATSERCGCRRTSPSSAKDRVIALPEGERERRGETDPGQIRHQQKCGRTMKSPEAHERGGDEQPQENDLDECDRAEMPLEEQPRPQRIGEELSDEEPER